MRETALFVNTSGAGLVERGALPDAMRAGTAALDVFETEPLTDPADPLLVLPNVVATPHIGYVTHEKLDL
ncbi:NAD(P)-dependent oxidoreductase [Variovorax brevis]|uniref:NAD(P)-dependent oxidoreductase n=1 Tax=Variovorax brevis TaxID=3053503 RepID=UPI0033658901